MGADGGSEVAPEVIQQERSEAAAEISAARDVNYARLIDAGATPDAADVACEWLMASGIGEVEPVSVNERELVVDCGSNMVARITFDEDGAFENIAFDYADAETVTEDDAEPVAEVDGDDA